MSAQLKLKPQLDGYTLAIRDWLSGENSGHLSPYMYINDADDHRWKHGHSSKAYYVGQDEKDTFMIALKNLDIRADNFLDLGPGGEQAVREKSLPIAQKSSIQHYFPVDLSPALALSAGQFLSKEMDIQATPVVADFYQKLPLTKANALISLLGLTLGNLETQTSLEVLQERLTGIFSHYRYAVQGKSYFLMSVDSNQNAQEIIDCYDNKEFGGLVRSFADKAIDTSDFDYHVKWTPENYQLATGLRSKRDQMVSFDGDRFAVEEGEFLPVLNSYRFPSSLIVEAAEKAGWAHSQEWSATGRVRYILFRAQ